MAKKTTNPIKHPVLVDAVAMSKAHPDTFAVPDTTCVSRGSWVKVCIADRERFWVEVERQNDDDLFVGRVDNDLIVVKDLKYNDRIAFHRNNIYQVLP